MGSFEELIYRWRTDADVLERHSHEGSADRLRSYAKEVEEVLTSSDSLEADDRLLSTEEAAERFKVQPATVAEWCREGRFPNATKTSGDAGDWRIPLWDVRQDPRPEKVGSERIRFD